MLASVRSFLILLLTIINLNAQDQKQFLLRTVAFYNLENLFDIDNDTLVQDDPYTPTGRYNWTRNRYNRKLRSLARSIYDIGDNQGPDIIGVCEVENIHVLRDLVSTPELLRSRYRIIHFDSPDERGIDVALLYKEDVFILDSFQKHRLLLHNSEGFRDRTRDILVVGGALGEEFLYILVNHWPSRRGGERNSRPYRIVAAQLNRKVTDSLWAITPGAGIVIMGDFNDNPDDISMATVLRGKAERHPVGLQEFYNPMYSLYKNGNGTLAYRDSWSLFDQILVSGKFVNTHYESLAIWKTGIHNPDYLITRKGRYRGYPFRTFTAGRYTGGYSDHFPVYIKLLKKLRR